MRDRVTEELVGIRNILAGRYKIIHKSFTSAAQEAFDLALKDGYDIDMDEWFAKVSSGPRKPSEGKTNSYRISLSKDGKEVRRMLVFQVYGMRNGYELNAYIS